MQLPDLAKADFFKKQVFQGALHLVSTPHGQKLHNVHYVKRFEVIPSQTARRNASKAV